MKTNSKNIKTWSEIKDDHFGKEGTDRRDQLDREFESFKIGFQLRQARKQKNLTHWGGGGPTGQIVCL